MADADNSMSAIQVEVFLTLFVPHMATFSLDNVNVEKGVNVK